MLEEHTRHIRNISLIGSGAVASHLAMALHQAGHTIVQVWSRTLCHAQQLADKVGAEATAEMCALQPADMYLVAVSDDAIAAVASLLPPDALVVHTAGAVALEVLPQTRRGVLYVPQSFVKEEPLDYQHLPFCIEGSDATVEQALDEMARRISSNVTVLNTEQRRWLHLSAVMANNFGNAINAVAYHMAVTHGIPFDMLLPIIENTAQKAVRACREGVSPSRWQTGPALRHDEHTLSLHRSMLAGQPDLKALYDQLTSVIQHQHMPRLIDTHTHLYCEEFDTDRDEVMQRALSAGVSLLLLPAIDAETYGRQQQMAEAYPTQVRQMMGLHPTSVNDNYEEALAQTHDMLFTHPDRYVAVGEIGLDYYWDTTHMAIQQTALRRQLQWAQQLDKPVSIHARSSRDGAQDAYAHVLQMCGDACRGVMHCFGGTVEQAMQAVAQGFYIGVGGVVTFRKALLADVVRAVPLNRIVLETDSPYLAPSPHRGQRNESAYLPLIAQKVAEIKGCSLAMVAEVTTANALRLFRLGKYPE